MKKIYQFINYCLAAIWVVNGFICKILHFVPRHELIVSNILSPTYARPITVIIGILEIFMAIWILSGYKSRWSAILQIVVVATMNIIEFIRVPELLLWGKMNALFATVFIIIVYVNEFVLRPKLKST